MSKYAGYSSISNGNDGDNGLTNETVALVATPESSMATTNSGTIGRILVQVRAPTFLTGGYELTVELDGAHWVALVPQRGVQEGELFTAELLRKVDGGNVLFTHDNPHRIPTGQWRDGLCDCCIHGCCHAACCLSTWCRSILLGQILYRMNLDICANPVDRQSGRANVSPFKFMLGLKVVVFIIMQIIAFAVPRPIVNSDGTIEYDPTTRFWINVAHGISFAFGFYLLLVTVKARMFIRRMYRIPPDTQDYVAVLEDCCCALWCPCCVVAQMARHTVDYTRYKATCCTNTGVHGRVPPAHPTLMNTTFSSTSGVQVV